MYKTAPVMWALKSIYDAEPDAQEFAPYPRVLIVNGFDYVITSEAAKVAEVAKGKGYTVIDGSAVDIEAGAQMVIVSAAESREIIAKHEVSIDG